mmetsp:Transcript_63657/g.139533  ORF Transcript_63657/g.139533 Transcript_63657/m.139533 type:complete len:279 (-) Transcript_63657:15-851(-)
MGVFTLEIVLQNLEGPKTVGRWSSKGEKKTLALRLSNLAPVLLEASLSGEFHGRGKALVFDLPAELQSGEAPLPLWIMLLLLAPGAPEDANRCATLVASSCIDLRYEVMDALNRQADLSASPVPFFRRCRFGMTSVLPESDALELTCFFRLYCGRHQPLTGGELLLEPIAWPDDLREGDEPMPAVALPRSVSPQGAKPRPQSKVNAAGAMFPREIELVGDAQSQVSLDFCAPQQEEEPAPPAMKAPAAPAMKAPAVSPALPMVSQLVRELMQISESAT